MKWQKAPDELKALFERAVRGLDCQERTMFGFPACFASTHMFAGIFETRVLVRLSQPLRAALERTTGPLPHLEPMPGRPMKEYFVLPRSFYSNEADFAALLEQSAGYARSLPPKQKKGRPAR